MMGVVRARASRAGLRGLEVRAAYLGHALPSVPDVLEALSEARPEHITDAARPGPPRWGSRPPTHAPPGRPVRALPLLPTHAYHPDTDLPAALPRAPTAPPSPPTR